MSPRDSHVDQDLRPPRLANAFLSLSESSPPIPESEVPRWSCVYKDRLFRVFSRRRFDLALPLDRLTRMRENDVDTAISGTALLRAFQRESLWIVLFNSDRNWRERVDDGGFEKRCSIEALITLEAIVFLAGNDMGRCWRCCDRHRVEIEPEIACYLFFLRGCDWTLPKSFVPTPCRHTRSDRGTASYLSPSTARNHRGEYTLQCSFDPYCWTAVDVHPSRALNYPLRRSNPFIPFGENVRQNFFSSRNIAPRNIRLVPHCLFRGRKEYFRDWKRNFEKKFANRIDEVFVEECYFWKKKYWKTFWRRSRGTAIEKKEREGVAARDCTGTHASGRTTNVQKEPAKRAWNVGRNVVDETAKERKRSSKNGGDREEGAATLGSLTHI